MTTSGGIWLFRKQLVAKSCLLTFAAWKGRAVGQIIFHTRIKIFLHRDCLKGKSIIGEVLTGT